MKSFDDFRKEILEKTDNRPEEWRKGQAVFNIIDSDYRVARDVQFIDGIDCFYDDDNINMFILLSWLRIID